MPRIFLTSAGKGKRAIWWTLAGIVLSQLALSIYLDKRWVETRDPLYGYRLHSLQARLAESPSAPLFLLLGSSRVKYSVQPAAMPIHAAPGSASPLVYNFGINGMGTIRELMYLRRLLADGICPKWLLVEIWPPLWPETGFFRESRMVLVEDDLHWRDVPLLCRYFRHDRDVLRLAFQKSVLPIRTYRGLLLGGLTQSFVPREQIEERSKIVGQTLPDDRNGWFPWPWTTSTPEEKRRAMQDGVEKIKPLIDSLCIDPRSDAALRELLAECQRHGIQTTLILMPEHSRTLSWYSPQAHTLVNDYLQRIQQEFQVPIVDTRRWQPDEHFVDACHLGQPGVVPFSQRLGREVVQPLIENRPLSTDILFGHVTK